MYLVWFVALVQLGMICPIHSWADCHLSWDLHARHTAKENASKTRRLCEIILILLGLISQGCRTYDFRGHWMMMMMIMRQCYLIFQLDGLWQIEKLCTLFVLLSNDFIWNSMISDCKTAALLIGSMYHLCQDRHYYQWVVTNGTHSIYLTSDRHSFILFCPCLCAVKWTVRINFIALWWMQV